VGGGGGGGDTWSDAGILGSIGGSGRSEDPWDSPKRIEQLLGLAAGSYKRAGKNQKKAWRHQAKAAYLVAREQRQGDTRGLAKVTERLASVLGELQRDPAFWARPARERNALLRAAREAPRAQPLPVVYSTVPAGTGGGQRAPGQRTVGGLSQQALAEWLRVVALLRQWWALQQQARERRDAERAQRGGTSMSFADILGGLGTVIQAATPIVQAVYSTRNGNGNGAAMLPASFVDAGAYGASGVPVSLPSIATGAGLGALGALLGGQPGALEEGGILETLESDIEREVGLWHRPTVGGRVSPVRTVYARHPQTGNIAAWEYAGRPVLYTRDLAVCKRVNKIARRTAARVGLRFRRKGR
jgi:hypothetical protein